MNLMARGSKGAIEDAKMKELSHFDSCVPRIYELVDAIPNDATGFIRMSD